MTQSLELFDSLPTTTTGAAIEIFDPPMRCSSGLCGPTLDETLLNDARRRGRSETTILVVDYFDLFDSKNPRLPPQAQLPVVLVEGVVVSRGGKISLPAIRRQVETCRFEGAQPDDNCKP